MKIFTVNKNTAVILALVSMLFALPETATAEYRSMIRYDRVWESVSRAWPFEVKYMRFDGEEEIGGKTYHRIVTFRQFPLLSLNGDCQEATVSDVSVPVHEGYLREENGVVYTLVSSSDKKDSEGFSWSGTIYIPETWPWSGEEHVTEETLYDFNRGVGESYACISFEDRTARENGLYINGMHTEVIDGEECNVYMVLSTQKNGGFLGYPLIEGIGPGESGCLNYHNLLERTAVQEDGQFLNRVYNDKGQVIYSSPRCDDSIPLYIPSGVNVIGSDPDSDAAVYDLTGRRISAPAPGQIYIRNGRKFVAPVR